ncbi:MAG: reverse transcriptase domain-containing protein [Caldilineaceae bacterium]
MAHRMDGKPQTPERLFTPALLRTAWRAVKRAKGGPGVDEVTLAKFEAGLDKELGALQLELISGVYRPQPVRQVLVPKANGGLRALAIWALRDRVAQRAVYELIAPRFEQRFLACSFGFRPGRQVADAVAALTAHRDQNLRWVVDADIKDCFDSIDAARLLPLVAQQLPERVLCHYIAGWLYAEIFNSADGLPKKAGASQGGVLSPLLANIYLHEVDQILAQRQLAYLRYADDFVICCRTKADAAQAFEWSRAALAQWGLQINDEKSHIRHFDQGFSWLGYFLVRRECYQL